MSSQKQIAANRQNARKSTGPRTRQGKLRTRRNAIRHGLCAETVLDIFENVEDYRTFERRIVREYRPKTTVQRELVFRLVSLLWRLRRATLIETGLFRIHSSAPLDGSSGGSAENAPIDLYRKLQPGSDHPRDFVFVPREQLVIPFSSAPGIAEPPEDSHLSELFLRLSNRSGDSFDRLRRYETTLWRQIAQTILLLGMNKLWLKNGFEFKPRTNNDSEAL